MVVTGHISLSLSLSLHLHICQWSIGVECSLRGRPYRWCWSAAAAVGNVIRWSIHFPIPFYPISCATQQPCITFHSVLIPLHRRKRLCKVCWRCRLQRKLLRLLSIIWAGAPLSLSFPSLFLFFSHWLTSYSAIFYLPCLAVVMLWLVDK